MGVIIAKKTKAQKALKLSPCENFHVYSTVNHLSFAAFLFRDFFSIDLFSAFYIGEKPVFVLNFMCMMPVTDIIAVFYTCICETMVLSSITKNKTLANKR